MLALTWYEWLKAGHVIAAVLWVGGGIMLTILGLMTIGLKDPARLAQFAGQVATLGGRFFPPVSLLVLALGIGMIENGDLGYDATWVQIAIAGWITSFAVGAAYLGPRAARLSKLLRERPPEDTEVQALIKRILLVARLDGLLLLFIVFVMTAKPWS